MGTALGSEDRPGVENSCDSQWHSGNSQGDPRGQEGPGGGQVGKGLEWGPRNPRLIGHREQVPVGKCGRRKRREGQRQAVVGTKGSRSWGEGPCKFRLLSLLPRRQ